ncbi:MAG: acyl-CoA dehydrogenase family protein [Niveispirillum sp.]|uniref:acyl-CoA dehydrogenase family protein n=1 Tax=Niveispirillum sp. TaxID=1917217 RepID=UPI0040366B49
MDFSLGDNQQMLANSMTRFLADRFTWKDREKAIDSSAGFSLSVWKGLAELGVIGSWFGERAGGYGGSAFDIGATFERLGHSLVTGPSLATLLAGRILEAAGERGTLEAVISGDSVLTFAHEPAIGPLGQPSPVARAVRYGNGWTVSGVKGIVDYLASADLILVTAQTDLGLSTFLVRTSAPGVSVRPYPLIDGGAAGELTLADAEARLVGAEGQADASLRTAFALGLTAVAWEAVGIMDAICVATVDYLRTRKQFGMAIGKFQALQHRMATVALEIEQARSAAINAAAHFLADPIKRDRYASAAKYTIGTVGALVAEEAIQMHGGIGMTWELPLSHFAKRLVMLNHVLGDEDHHLARHIALGRAA